MKAILDHLILDDLLFPYVSDAFPSKYVGKET